jgi:hypothetical protein
MNLERYINQRNIERYLKLLEHVSDDTQRRQIINLLDEEQDRAEELVAHAPIVRAA